MKMYFAPFVLLASLAPQALGQNRPPDATTQSALDEAQRAMSSGTESVYVPDPERAKRYDRLYQAYSKLAGFGPLEEVAELRPHVDRFFDKVMVNAPDPNVRQNRLALLHAILTESSTIADFSEIVTNS